MTSPLTDLERLHKGVSHAARGYLLYYVDINLGTVSVLPKWGACLLFLSAIDKLKPERRDLALLRPLGVFLAAYYGVDWLLSWKGAVLSGRFSVLDLLVAVAALYFHFQFLTDCAALAAAYQPEGLGLDGRLFTWRTIQTLLITVLTLMLYGSDWLGKAGEYIMAGLAVAGVVTGLCLMAALFTLRKLFAGMEPPPIETES